ncbi:MAG TPA: hypothetical protein VK211_18140 [Kamptonema sp.]|nr:hypothetical protein [Kamptonema sp.]
MYEQGLIVFPNLARLGFGVGAGGQIVDTDPYFAIAFINLISSAFLGCEFLLMTTTKLRQALIAIFLRF